MSKGIGYAKTILFGEHFVVYGMSAIGIGLSKKTEVVVEKSPHMKIESNYADANLLKGIEAVKSAMKIHDNFIIKITSEIPMGGGLGSSAALSVAFVRALSDEYGLNLSDAQVSSYAYEAEKIYHGSPSGIDNSLATFGGAIVFQKREEGSIITQLKIKNPLHIIIGNPGKRNSSTKELISAVRSRKEKHPEIYDFIFSTEKKIIESAIKAIENGDLEELGELMNMNHGILSTIGVSSKKDEDIVHTARECGALGAKITGAGCGGSCVILAKDEKHAELIANEIKKIGYITLIAVVQ
ncbi:MAG: mevalonate kinase [Candidatus Micrarchaeota archaeon]